MSEKKVIRLDELAVRLRGIFEKYRIKQGMVFGSFARGEASRHSDLDLLLIQVTDKPFLKRYEGILQEITQTVSDRDIDLLIYTPQELTRLSHQRWIARILQEGKIIYESECEPTSS